MTIPSDIPLEWTKGESGILFLNKIWDKMVLILIYTKKLQFFKDFFLTWVVPQKWHCKQAEWSWHQVITNFLPYFSG